MRKKCCLLLIVLCLLAPSILMEASAQSARDTNLQSAFENDTLALHETQFVPDFTGYTLRVSAASYEQKAEIEGVAPAYPADGAWVSLDLNGLDFHPTPCFFSPDGSKAILMDEEHAYILEGKVITMILPNYLRSVRDIYASFVQFNKLPPAQSVGSEGVTWSPDGRYIVLTNYKRTLMLAQFIYGLYIIDTESGELFCVETYPNKMRDGAASVIQTCFDASGRYLYYMLYGSIYPDSRVSLMCYDMETGEKQRILACPKDTAYPRLEMDSRGRLVNLLDTNRADEFLGLNVFEQKNGVWISTAYEFSQPSATIRPLYMEIGGADMGIMLHMLRYQDKGYILAGRFIADDGLTGYNELLLIEGMNAPQATVLPLSAYGDGSELAGKIGRSEVLQCLNIKLSPDGHYAMLLVTDRKTYSFLMMDMETLRLHKVESPSGTTSMRAGNGVPPSNDYPSGYNWFEGNKVVILSEDGLKTYEFAY